MTVLVVIVAVFLSYNANNGPAVRPDHDAEGPRRQRRRTWSRATRSARAASASAWSTDMSPVRLADGQTGAELTLKLDKTIGDVPEDSRCRIRPRSALGLKYLELERGPLEAGVPGRRHGARLAGSPTPTSTSTTSSRCSTPRRARPSQENLHGFGDSFAGRGTAVGRTVEELPALARAPRAGDAQPRRTRTPTCRGFFKRARRRRPHRRAGLQAATRALFTSMADTFEALGRDPRGAQGPDRQVARRRWTRRSRRSASSARSSPT